MEWGGDTGEHSGSDSNRGQIKGKGDAIKNSGGKKLGVCN